jgi:hypothetical protein
MDNKKKEGIMAQVALKKSEYADLPNIVQVLIDGKIHYMSQPAFDEYCIQSAQESLKDIENGIQGKPVEQVFKELRKKHGLGNIYGTLLCQ